MLRSVLFSASCGLLFAAATYGQTLHIVTAAGTAFSPASLEIFAGDTVRFVNEAGFHNVNGTQETFPGNPVSFGNELGNGWVFDFKFEVPGTYHYRCDQHFGMGMLGEIQVMDTILSVPHTKNEVFKAFPNPVKTELRFSGSEGGHFRSVQIINSRGGLEKVQTTGDVINVSGLAPGTYTYRVSTESSSYSGRFVKE